jgi:PKD repeat protein
VPDFLQPGDSLNVTDWQEIKGDTGAIHWETPSGTPYTLSAAGGDQNVHNGQAYGLKLPGRQIIDPEKVATQASATHVWHSGRGNDFGCSPTRGHNLDLYLPELAGMASGTPVTLEFKSSWDIEWDWDFGFVLTTPDGETYTSQPSIPGYTTDNAFNPNRIDCQADLNNGLTGTSGAYQQGPAVVTAARIPGANDYSHGSPFLLDTYDVSELAGQPNPVVRFSYFTDGAFDRPGWFIDDIVVRAGGEVIYSSDFETDDEPDRLFPGGCRADGGRVAASCTDGWSRIAADQAATLDHAYYLELRDQSGFDFNGHNQSERGDTSWQPGLFVEYTDEAHGYGNNGTPPPPAQHYLDSQPIPGSDCVTEQSGNCADVSFTGSPGDSHFSDSKSEAQPQGFINSFENPDSAYGDGLWHFDYGCLTLDVTAMSGEGMGPESPVTGDLNASATITAGEGCAPFAYGRGGDGAPNQAPIADAQARPIDAKVGEPITFDGSGSTDDRQAPEQLGYAWSFGDGESATGQTVHHAYAAPGTYEVTLTVTDADGATGTDTITVTVTGEANLRVTDITTVAANGTGGGKPKAGERVVIQATVTNGGSADAAASQTAFELDGQALAGSPVDTPAIPAGGSTQVELSWDTRGLSGDHIIGVTADAGEAVVESNEDDNASTRTVSVRGNKVTNGDFEQSNAAGDGPEAWSGSSGEAGTTSWSEEGGTDGSHGAAASGNGGNATLLGVPTWTSAPIDVAPGEALSLQVTVSTDGVSSAPAVGLAYLGAAGELLSTVRLIDVPLDTGGFTTLETAVTLPPGVAQVRVVLFGFAPTDLRTAGTVVFDDVGLYAE